MTPFDRINLGMCRMDDLPMGTQVWITNGNWSGRICGTAKKPMIFIDYTGEMRPITDAQNGLCWKNFAGKWECRTQPMKPKELGNDERRG